MVRERGHESRLSDVLVSSAVGKGEIFGRGGEGGLGDGSFSGIEITIVKRRG